MSSDLGSRPIQFTSDVFHKTLHELVSLDHETKQAAKKTIQALEIQATDEFGETLVNYVDWPSGPREVREIASAILKQYVKAHWCSMTEGFQPPEIALDSKIKIKDSLLLRLRNSSSKVREDVAYTISTIFRSDGPENWPQLFDTLVTYLDSEEYGPYIPGVMQAFTAFTKELTDTNLPHVGPIILQEVYKMFEKDERWTGHRCLAVGIFAEMVTTISGFEQPSLIQQYLEPSVSKFCTKFLQNDLWSNTELGCEMLKAIQTLTKTLPKCMSVFLSKLLPLIWETLTNCAKVYQESTINVNRNIRAEGEEPEGENSVVEDIDNNGEAPERVVSLVIIAFEFIRTLMNGSNGYASVLPEYNLMDYHWFYLQDSLPPEVLRHLIIFMEITDRQMEQWTKNPSQFVIEENLTDDLSCANSIRGKAQELLTKIIHRPERAAANALCDGILKQTELAGNATRTNDNSDQETPIQNWWKSHEASIQVFGLIKDAVAKRQQAETLSFDVTAFLENVVLANLNKSESHPLLIGRCLYVGGLYAEQMPVEMRSQFLESTIKCLKNQPACTRILAAKAANYWLCAASISKKNADTDNILKHHLPALFQELFNLGNEFMSVEVLPIVLENFVTLALLDKAFTALVGNKIAALAIAAFVNFRSNCSILGICQKIFKELTLNPECIESLQTNLVPILVGKLAVRSSEDSKDEEIQVDALEVLMLLVQNSPQPLSGFLIKSAFPATCRFILISDKYCTLLKGGKVIRMFLSVAADQVIGYKNTDGNTGLKCISQVVVHLLNSQPSNLLVEDACEIVTSLVKKAGNTLGENLDPVLTAVFNSMQRVEGNRLQKLLLVLAHLIKTEFEAVFNFLSTAKGPNEQCALTFVISNGFCREHKSLNQDDRRTVTLALSKILEFSVTRQDSELHKINFHAAGDTETAIPLVVEISRLISNELSANAYRSH